VTGGVHGNNRLGGNSLLECTVFGTIVGQRVPIRSSPSKVSAGSTLEVTEVEEKAALPVISMEELAKHNTAEDLWVAVHGVVYDFTDFADEHPAGAESIIKLAGTDGTAAFAAVHNQNMLEDFEEDKKGILQVSTSLTTPVSAVSNSTSTDKRVVTLEELKEHSKPEDCWVAFHGEVYNMTHFSETHPGGAHLILDVAGSDGTEKFMNVHKKGKLRLVEDAFVGTLQEMARN